MTELGPFVNDDRGVSIAVTHVLTIGITTILVAGLLIGASSMLDYQRESSTDASLETIGERLANEISKVDRAAAGGGDVRVTTSHQQRVTGSGYSIDLQECTNGELIPDETPCLVLESFGEDRSVTIPLALSADIDDGGPVAGGNVVIVADGDNGGEISLEEAGS